MEKKNFISCLDAYLADAEKGIYQISESDCLLVKNRWTAKLIHFTPRGVEFEAEISASEITFKFTEMTEFSVKCLEWLFDWRYRHAPSVIDIDTNEALVSFVSRQYVLRIGVVYKVDSYSVEPTLQYRDGYNWDLRAPYVDLPKCNCGASLYSRSNYVRRMMEVA